MSAEQHEYDGPLNVVYQYDPDCWCHGTGEHDDDVTCGAWVIDGGEPDVNELSLMLRRRTVGDPTSEAAVELLISHGHWLRVARLRPYVDAYLGYDHRTRLPDVPMAHFDWPTIATALDERRFPASTSELAVLRIAASLGSRDVAVNLRDALSGLDNTNSRLVVQAIAHAAGIRKAVR